MLLNLEVRGKYLELIELKGSGVQPSSDLLRVGFRDTMKFTWSGKHIYAIFQSHGRERGLVLITAYSSGRKCGDLTLSSHYSHWLCWSSLTLDPEGHQHAYDPLELPHGGPEMAVIWALQSGIRDVGCQGEGTSLGVKQNPEWR